MGNPNNSSSFADIKSILICNKPYESTWTLFLQWAYHILNLYVPLPGEVWVYNRLQLLAFRCRSLRHDATEYQANPLDCSEIGGLNVLVIEREIDLASLLTLAATMRIGLRMLCVCRLLGLVEMWRTRSNICMGCLVEESYLLFYKSRSCLVCWWRLCRYLV